MQEFVHALLPFTFLSLPLPLPFFLLYFLFLLKIISKFQNTTILFYCCKME